MVTEVQEMMLVVTHQNIKKDKNLIHFMDLVIKLVNHTTIITINFLLVTIIIL